MKNFYSLIPRIKKISIFAYPISLTGLVNISMNFVAMIFIARLGINEIAAATLATSLYITLLVTSTASLYALSILISHQFSKWTVESGHAIGALFRNSIVVSAILSAVTGVFLWNGDKFLYLIGQNEALVRLTPSYFHYAAYSLFPNLLAMSVGQFYLGIGNSNFGLINSLMRLPFAWFLSYVLILGRLGFPQLGLAGVTCANLIVNSLYSVVILIFMAYSKKLKSYRLFTRKQFFNWGVCKQILFLGIPIGVQFGGELLVMTVLTFLLGYIGAVPLAASQIVSQFGLLAVMMVLGLTQATSVLVSMEYAQNNRVLIKEYAKAIQIVLMLFFLCWGIILLLFHNFLLNLFVAISEPENQLLKYYSLIFFAISFVTMYIDSIRNSFSAILRGMQDSKTPMNIGLICLWFISLPCACLLAFGLHLGAVGLQLGFISGFLVASLLLKFRMSFILR